MEIHLEGLDPGWRRPRCASQRPFPPVAHERVAYSPFLPQEKEMQQQDPNRREFTTWIGAALGGLLAGLSTVRAADEKPKSKDPKKPLLLQEPHVCRGLNPTCKGEVQGQEERLRRARPTVPRPRPTPARARTTAPGSAAAASTPARTSARAWASAPCRSRTRPGRRRARTSRPP